MHTESRHLQSLSRCLGSEYWVLVQYSLRGFPALAARAAVFRRPLQYISQSVTSISTIIRMTITIIVMISITSTIVIFRFIVVTIIRVTIIVTAPI